MVEIELVLPEFIKRVRPNCKVYSHIRGQHGLAGYVLLDQIVRDYYYLTYIRNPFITQKKIGIDKSILIEANHRYKATIVKAMTKEVPDTNGRYQFYACDAKEWYRYVVKHNTWRPTTNESEDLGNIPISMFHDMEKEPKENDGLGAWGIH